MAGPDIQTLLAEAERLSAVAEANANKATRETRASPYASRIPSATPSVGEIREAEKVLMGPSGGLWNPPRALAGNAMRAMNEPYAALEALANLSNLKRARLRGYGANVAGAREAMNRNRSDPWRNAPAELFEEIKFPYPQAAGVVTEAVSPFDLPGDTALGLLFSRGLSSRAVRRGASEAASRTSPIRAGAETIVGSAARRRTLSEAGELFEEILTNPKRVNQLANQDPDVYRAARQLEMYHSAYDTHRFPSDIDIDDPKEVLDIIFTELGPAKGNWFLEEIGFAPVFSRDYAPTGTAWMLDWDEVGLEDIVGDLGRQLNPDQDRIRRASEWLRRQGINPDDAF